MEMIPSWQQTILRPLVFEITQPLDQQVFFVTFRLPLFRDFVYVAGAPAAYCLPMSNRIGWYHSRSIKREAGLVQCFLHCSIYLIHTAFAAPGLFKKGVIQTLAVCYVPGQFAACAEVCFFSARHSLIFGYPARRQAALS